MGCERCNSPRDLLEFDLVKPPLQINLTEHCHSFQIIQHFLYGCQQWSTAISYSRNKFLKIRRLTRRLYQLPSHHCFDLKLAGLFIFCGSRGGQNQNGPSLNIPALQGAGHRFAYHQCKYHHVHGANQRNLSIISIASSSKITRDAKLDFALLNARSICNKSRVINDYIADYDFDIFAVTETWLRGDDYDQYYIRDICPDGYKFYHIPRIHSTGGGVGVVLKDSFSVETIPCGHYGSFESIELTLKISGFFCPPNCFVSPSWSQYIVVL